MEYEKCYVFHPDTERAQKRRRLEPSGLQASWRLRRKLYQEVWRQQEIQIEERLSQINAVGVQKVVDYLDKGALSYIGEKIPTGFILAGPSAISQNSTIEQLAIKLACDKRRIFVSLSSNTGPNLKALLKAIIHKATSITVTDDDEELEPVSRPSGHKLLSYDLQILQNYVNERDIAQTIIAFKDTEAFDSRLLAELLELLNCWRDRLHLTCLFNIATSVEFLQQRLSKAAVRCIHGALFDVKPSNDEVEEVIDVLTQRPAIKAGQAVPKLWIGPRLLSSILERQTDYTTGIEACIESVRFAHMACFYANAASLVLDGNVKAEHVSKDHFRALRQLPSFQQWAEQLISEGDTDTVRHALDSDDALWITVRQAIEDGTNRIHCMINAIDVFRTVQSFLPEGSVWNKSRLYAQAMSGKMQDSPLIRTILLAIRKSSSDTALQIIRALLQQKLDNDHLQALLDLSLELSKLTTAQESSSQPLRSEDSLADSSLRTTVVAKKVSLSKFKTSLTKQDAAYTSIVRRLSDLLEGYFNDTFIDPKHDLPFHEIFVYDLKSPHRELFTPRPRHAIERGLAVPHDYLACDCCAPKKGDSSAEADDTTLSAGQPPTAVLYQLYLESEGLINASDLWHAFHAVLGGEDIIPEIQAMALFQRGLAELKYFGMIKATRKKTDHIAKVAWRGL